MSGERRKTAIAPRPGKRPNTSPTAPNTPSTIATPAESSARRKEVTNAAQNGSSPQIFRYQRNENWLVGRSNTNEGENETRTTITIGSSK